MKPHFCYFSELKKYSPDLMSSFGLADLMRFCLLLLVFLLSELLSVSLGNISDISEWLMLLDDNLLIESVAFSLVSVLLINPRLIEQICCVFYVLPKAFYRLFLNNIYAVLQTPLLRNIERSAHGCRAPPTLVVIL